MQPTSSLFHTFNTYRPEEAQRIKKQNGPHTVILHTTTRRHRRTRVLARARVCVRVCVCVCMCVCVCVCVYISVIPTHKGARRAPLIKERTCACNALVYPGPSGFAYCAYLRDRADNDLHIYTYTLQAWVRLARWCMQVVGSAFARR